MLKFPFIDMLKFPFIDNFTVVCLESYFRVEKIDEILAFLEIFLYYIC